MAGIPVIAQITRQGGANFPLAVAEDIKGAFVTVADTTARDAIPTNILRTGALLRIAGTNNFYEWSGSVWSLYSGFGSSGHTIKDEGIAVTPRTSLNFVGVNVTVTDDGSNTVVTIGQISLTAGVTGVLPVANGGTGLSAGGANGQILTMVSGAPAWATPGGGSLTAPSNPGDDGKLAIASAGNFTYALAANAHISPTAAIVLTKLADGSACSVVGRSANSSGAHADIASSADGEVFRRAGGALGWGTIATAGIADSAVTLAKIANATALSVLGRSANSVGPYADMAAANDGEVMRRSGATLGFGPIATAGIADDAVTYAKIQNVSAASRVIGRGSASGAGDAEELTPTGGVTVSGTNLQLNSVIAPLATAGAGLQLARMNSGGTAAEWFTEPTLPEGTALTNANVTKNISDGSSFTLAASTLASSAKTFTMGTTGTPETDDIVYIAVFSQSQNYIIANGGPLANTVYTVVAGTKRLVALRWDGANWAPAGKWRLN